MSLASRTFAPDLEAYAESYGPQRFLQLLGGDPRPGEPRRVAPLAVRRVAGSANEAEAARLLAALDETVVRQLHAEWRAEWERYHAHSRRRDDTLFMWAPFPEWPVSP